MLALLCACGSPKPAEEPAAPTPTATTPPPPPPPSPPLPSLYERLGKKEALAGVVEELMANVLDDKRISKFFDKARKDKTRWKLLGTRMVAELCVVSGGGDECAYDGKPMKDAHAGMNIGDAQWDAFVEDLSIALKTRSVDPGMAKELLDKVQDTKGDIAPAAAKPK
jgi:hemoglobin